MRNFEMNFADLKFNDQGLIPAIAQDVNTKEVFDACLDEPGIH
jgi:hypothetical protein